LTSQASSSATNARRESPRATRVTLLRARPNAG
jgi:hypothetical protein